MNLKMFGVVAVAAMALTGCTSTCEDLEDALDEYQDKAQPCGGDTTTTFNMNQCENNVDKCSGDDKEALADFADCLRDLPTCSTATEDNFNAAAIGCAFTLVGKASEQCLDTIGASE